MNNINHRLYTTLSEYRGTVHTLIIAPFLVLFSYLALSEPSLNWDMIAYIANATQYITNQSVAEIQEMIYTSLPHSVPADKISYYTNTGNRIILANDPEAFGQTIKFFYDTRIVYIGLLAGLMQLGMDPFFASYFISTVCSVLSILLLARLIPFKFPLGLCVSLPFIALACGLMTVARFSSPDALAAFVIIVMYWLLIRNYLFALLLLISTSVFVRTDLILLMPMFLGYLFALNRISRVLIVLTAVATVSAYFALNHVIVDGDPWSSLIGYNFGPKPTHPADHTFTVTLNNYFWYIVDGIKSFSYNPLFFMFCALSVTGIFLFGSRFFFNPNHQPVSRQHLDLLFLLVSCVAYVAAHFLLFPVTWIRFFAAQYTLVSVVVLWATLAILSERNHSDRFDVNLLDK